MVSNDGIPESALLVYGDTLVLDEGWYMSQDKETLIGLCLDAMK